MSRRTGRTSSRMAAVGLALMLAALSACSDSSASGPKSLDEDSLSGDVPKDIPQVVRIGMPSELSSFDPLTSIQEVDVMGLALVSGTLMRVSGDGVQPDLAEECNFDDALTAYTCSLREDARFSDGSPVEAADVVASFERLLESPENVNAGLVSNIETVVSEADSVVFRLKKAQASFPLALTQGPLGVFPAERLNEDGFFSEPVVAGPYVPVSNTPREVRFRINEHYDEDQRPLLEEIRFRAISDENTRILQLESGQIDIAHTLSASAAGQVKEPAQATVTSQYGGIYIYMNNKNEVLADLNVRKAISLAVDRQRLNEVAYLGENTPIGSFFPSVMEGHDPTAQVDRDVDAAKGLLAGTPCESGCSFEIMVRAGYAPYDSMAAIVQQNLSEIGIDVRLKPVDQAAANDAEINGNFDAEVGNLYDTTNAPELIMLTYGLTPAGGINSLFSYYDNSEVNELSAALNAAADPDERASILDRINARFAADLPYVPLLDAATIWATTVSPRVIAFTPSGTYKVGTESRGPGE